VQNVRKVFAAVAVAIAVVPLVTGAQQSPRLPSTRHGLQEDAPDTPGLPAQQTQQPQNYPQQAPGLPQPYYSPPQPRWATGCFTQYGACYLPPQAVAVGAGCYCNTQVGPIGGSAQ
jgi:hypothetical protein